MAGPTSDARPPASGDNSADKLSEAHPAREHYRRYFETVVVGQEDSELREQVHRLRYQVYCVEHAFEDPTDKPDGLESDSYDDRAVHCLLRHRGTSSWAGTARLILPNTDAPAHSFALQEVCHEPRTVDPERFPIMQMAEVSRFCISKHFRQRQGDWLYPTSNSPEDNEDERRVIPNMILGLIEGLVDMSLRSGVTYWCAVMEPPLLRLLARLGIVFENVGPIVDYHGRRQPCVLELSTMLRQVRQKRPDVWDILTDGGRHWARLMPGQAAT